MPEPKTSKDIKEVPFDNPLTGRLIHPGAEDPIKIGETDFQVLQNFRYTPTGVRGVSGMTKANSNALPSNYIQEGIQFNKYLPVPNSTTGLPAGNFSYNVVYVTDNSSVANLVRSNNTVVAPGVDTYSVLTSSVVYGTVEMSAAPDGALVVCDGTRNLIWGGDEIRCASFLCVNTTNNGYLDFTTEINNSLTDATNVATIQWWSSGGSFAAGLLIGSTRPINGIKFYVANANTQASTLGVTYMNTYGVWTSVSGLTDGTKVAGVTLAQTGIVSFNNTSSIAAVSLQNNEVLYWYQVVLTCVGVPSVAISSCTLSAAVQPIKDIWDGIYRAEASFQVYTPSTGYTDYSAAVLNNTYPANNTATGEGYYFAPLGNQVAGEPIFVGCTERLSGIVFALSEYSTYPNISYVDYWNGSAWVNALVLADTTVGFRTSGTMAWFPPAAEFEMQTVIGNNPEPFFYYRVSFGGPLSPTVNLYYVAGIPVQTVIQPHKIPVIWQDRLWLLCNLQGNANEALCSSSETNCVFNGTDSITLGIGDNTPILAAGALYSRYGGSIYDDLIIVKAYQTYLIDGISPATWTVFVIAPNVGITAPKTFTICDTGYELAPGLTKHIAAWVSASGPVMFDGNGVIPIEGDIKGFWDPGSPYYVQPSVMALASAWFDSVFREWHLVFAGMEWVYDVNKKKWWQANRGTGKALACGWVVKDGNGFSYSFGGTSDGSIECLENGTTMDGNPIAYDLRTGDTPPEKSGMAVTTIRHVKLVAKTKANADIVTFNWYGDGQLTPTLVSQLAQNTQDGQYRVYQAVLGPGPSVEMQAVFHSFEITASTTDETIGLEPVMISASWKNVREDVYGRY